MSTQRDKRNRLVRDGTSQSQRVLAALDPTSAPVDERRVDDFLAFALEFSKRVVHIGIDGARNTWEPFFGCDPSAIISAIEKHNPQPIRDKVLAIVSGNPEREALDSMFGQLGELAYLLDYWYYGVRPSSAFGHQVGQRLRANLLSVIRRLSEFNDAAHSRFGTQKRDFREFLERWQRRDEIERREQQAKATAHTVLEEDPEAQEDPAKTQREAEERRIDAADHVVFGGHDSESDQIRTALGRLQNLFVPMYNVALEVIDLAPRYFARDLFSRRDREPHFVLFVAFLRLYTLLRDDANKLTGRHLEFFYRKVLGISNRPAVPDHLHVVAELARRVKDEHRLIKGTMLDAGKDDTGVPMRFATDSTLVANKALIASYRTVFVTYDRAAADFPQNRTINTVSAAPIANSQDGAGADFEDKDRPSWPTLGSSDTDGATIGFAIASRALLLAEGKRTITLKFDVDHVPEGTLDLEPGSGPRSFDVSLSGEEGWITPDAVEADIKATSSTTIGDVLVRSGELSLTITLESTNDAVAFADVKVLEEDFGTRLPLLKVVLHHPGPEEPGQFAYGLLKALQLRGVTLSTDVEGTTAVTVQNDDFAMDASKSFQPFGPTPRRRSNFYVGSQEAFQKELTKITLNLTWDELPEESFAKHYMGYFVPDEENKSVPALTDYTVKVSTLEDGKWADLPSSYQLFEDDGDGIPGAERALELPVDNLDAQIIDELDPWTPATQHGFLRLQLDGRDFFHKIQAAVLTRQAIATARMPECTRSAVYRIGTNNPEPYYGDVCTGKLNEETDEAVNPNPPYTPTIKTITLDYSASASSKDESGSIELIHIEPFGTNDVDLSDSTRQPYLLPQFDHEGTLYIGLQNLKPLSSLSVLFQVSEATADTNVRKPKVVWSWLGADDWVEFREHEITLDETRGLIDSGVITFSIPREVSSENRRMPSDLHWLRAHVEVDARGVSELIEAHTQAVRATFVDQDNDPKRVAKPLAAGTVSGLVTDDADVAGLDQPYESFDGRIAEDGLEFYKRVAEHLRHKGRAITLFDYERLLLQQFPGIYKAKCINHTDAYHNNAPGHVLIAVIPDFTQLKAVDRRRPKVTVDKLDEIADYLQDLNCPFARNDRGDDRTRLLVSNPIYEQVRVAFSIRFNADISAIEFHRRLLNDSINRFLSPWGYEDGAEIAFGGVIYKSSILNFVEEQPYVDYVTDFVMSHTEGGDDVDAIEATTPRSILVPAEEHGISPIAGDERCPLMQPTTPDPSLGFWTVNHDFEVAPTEESS